MNALILLGAAGGLLSLLPVGDCDQDVMRKVDGWKTLATKPIDQPIDLAA